MLLDSDASVPKLSSPKLLRWKWLFRETNPLFTTILFSRCTSRFPKNKWKYPTCLPLLCVPRPTSPDRVTECVRMSGWCQNYENNKNFWKTSAHSDSLLPAWVLWWNQSLLECLRASHLELPLIVSLSNRLWHTWHCVSMMMLCRFSGEAGHRWLVLMVLKDIAIRVCCLAWWPPHLCTGRQHTRKKLNRQARYQESLGCH